MKALLLFFSALMVYSSADSQKLVNNIDSLINSIESSKAFTMISRCDTVMGDSHSDYFYIYCDEFYRNNNNKIFKIISKVDRIRFSTFYDTLYGHTPRELGTIEMEVFYFEKDSLIKICGTDYSDNSAEIHYYYFTQGEIQRLKFRWEEYKDRYFQIKDWVEQAEKLLHDFKQGKIK